MFPAVPSPKAEIKTTNKGEIVIDDDELLVVSLSNRLTTAPEGHAGYGWQYPVESHVPSVLENIVIWMPH